MKTDAIITREIFIKRLVDLCVRSGLTDFPKNEADQHILMKSMVITMDPTVTYSEKEINRALGTWIDEVGQIKNIDFGTLRRWLVDSGYLTRSRDGSTYHVSSSVPNSPVFEDAVNGINPAEAIIQGRAEIERRKMEYMQKAKEHDVKGKK